MVQVYPKETRALCLARAKDGPFFYDAVLKALPVPALKYGQILVRMGAAGFNHKEVSESNSRYPGVKETLVFP